MNDSLMTGFGKWLSSTKFQIAAAAMAMAYGAVPLFAAAPDKSLEIIRDIAIAYMGSRVLEPLIDLIAKKVGGNDC